ncbi:thiopeptide-type bacteriocin biosynthesis protein [Pseudofrankia sp. BMG5.36]|uniref:thiopeptide-type bacteriocin biosynthesis protein n=1 Tax=Pseudofrankia sp. BMG5.36 TaxID=1834512 RepID=UPI0008D8F15F|nr:thiopeptide-type bacteriocin biosynthesis protein [Pseudofrankia sp. BMG5.36]OHV63664.1 methyltransferase [Pseudofrankia sp. BMG5.36]
MPADQLAEPMNVDSTEQAVLSLLTGRRAVGLTTAATGLETADLQAAAEIYRAAGRAALTAHRAAGWQQVYLRFRDWGRADAVAATHLLPILLDAEQSGMLDAWWFIRKHPCWRLRLRPSGPGPADAAGVGAALDRLTAAGHLDAWWPGIYEAETAAFGGGLAMDAAHELFTADSRAILCLAATPAVSRPGRRELSILLCGAFLHGAGLEWYERGDVWARVCAERRLPVDASAGQVAALSETVTVFLRADTAPNEPIFGAGGPAATHAAWASAFTQAGRRLAEANRTGRLHRGLREVLSYHVLFHWNRIGLAARHQALLAHAAHRAILGPSSLPKPQRARPSAPPTGP